MPRKAKRYTSAMKKIPLIILFLCLFCSFEQASKAQDRSINDPLTAEDRIYEREFALGGMLHTGGFGIAAQWVKIKNIYTKTVREISIMDMHHSKEDRQQSGLAKGRNAAKSYLYGKQNSLYVLDASVGKVRMIAEKARRSGVSLGVYYGGGISLGLVKPYYLEIIKPSDTGLYTTEAIRYTPETDSLFLDQQRIYGAAGFSYGWKELQFHPGINLKAGLNFDWASYQEFVKAVEMGVSVHGFLPEIGGLFKGEFSGISLMINEDNSYFYANLYLRLLFGKRW